MRQPAFYPQIIAGLSFRRGFASVRPRVAVLHQALEPPVINGVRKPKKPGGYKDSGADIAYVLREKCQISVLTPAENPDPAKDADWTFPDHEEGVLSAVKSGATHLWANTILFKNHPLQTSQALTRYEDGLRVVGQPPLLVEAYDDKNYVNSLLRQQGSFTLPKSCTLTEADDLASILKREKLAGAIVGKPVRGRGSHGVKLCNSTEELSAHVQALLKESPTVLLEEYLAGQEGTVTVMPPSEERPEYWAMPVVVRFNHIDGIAPYNGVVAVTANSRVVSDQEAAADWAYVQVAKECEAVARLLQTKAPIRIDVRRFNDKPGSPFALFDVNMKPNMTGPGRPGREDQASLTALAAAGLGWNYPRLLQEILHSASSLKDIRNVKPPF